MRFDWSCTGDSEGDVYDGRSRSGSKRRDRGDELRDAAGVRRVSIIGMRLGRCSPRSGRAGRRSERAAALEPVFRGADYIADLERLDYDIATRRQHRIEQPRVELAGYPFPSALRASIAALELKEHLPKSAGRVSMFLKAEQPEADDVVTTWKRAA